MNNPLRATWEKACDSVTELFELKSLVEKETDGISDEVVIIPIGGNRLLVTVWITVNTDYWDDKLTKILGEKEMDI